MVQRMLIGICGNAGSGKDEVGKILVRDHGFTRVAFADKLKAMAIDRGWSGRKDDEGRRLLQDLGLEMRAKDPAYWVREALRTMDTIDGPIVVTDMRFMNEAATIEGRGGHLWRVERPGVGPANNHVSEHEWRACHNATWIHNDGTLDALRIVVAHHVRHLSP